MFWPVVAGLADAGSEFLLRRKSVVDSKPEVRDAMVEDLLSHWDP